MIDPLLSVGAATLKVASLETMVAFYRDVIGLLVLRSSAEIATLGTPTRPLLHLRHLSNGRFGRRHSGLYHLALCVSSRKSLATWFHHYVDAGGSGWQGAGDHGVSEALYLSDPEGNGIEVYRDRPRSQWQIANDGTIALPTMGIDLQALLKETDDSDFTAIDAATEMGHVHLRVSNIAVAKQFYIDLLGFGLKMEMPGSALFVAAGGYHHHLGLNNWQSKDGADNSAELYGLDQFELVFDSAESRQQTIDHLTAHRHPIHTNGDAVTVYDPFQNKIALTIR